MAKIQHGKKGFWITFDNGYTLSIQYGLGNYCSRRNYSKVHEPKPNDIESEDFEMAVMAPGSHKLIDLCEYDQVQGWISFEHLPKIMECVQAGEIGELKEFLFELR